MHTYPNSYVVYHIRYVLFPEVNQNKTAVKMSHCVRQTAGAQSV